MRRTLLIRITNIQTTKHQKTLMMARVLEAALIMMNKPFSAKTDSTGGAQFPPKLLQDDYSSAILLEFVQDLHHIPHPASYAQSSFFVPRPFQQAHAEEYLKVHCTTTKAHCANENNSWTVMLDELGKSTGLIVPRGAIGGKTSP